MRSKTCWLLLVLSLSVLSPCFSAGIPQTELIAMLSQILMELETASTEVVAISTELEKARIEQKNTSNVLETIVEKRLPDTDRQLSALENSFDEYVNQKKRDDARMLGAVIVTFIVSIVALVL